MIGEVLAAALGVLIGVALALLVSRAVFIRIANWQRFSSKDLKALAGQVEILLKRWGKMHDRLNVLEDPVLRATQDLGLKEGKE